MKQLFNPLFVIALSVLLLTACSMSNKTASESSNANMPNPASTFCAEHGGQSNDGQCMFADGSTCEEWAFFNGECKAGASASLAKDFPQYDATKASCPAFKPADEGIENADGKPAQWVTQGGNKKPVSQNGIIQLGLQNKSGSATDNFTYEVIVKTPDNKFVTTEGTVSSNQVSQKTFPKDFASATTTTKGVYSLVYKVNDQIIACDGFVVQ